MSMREDLLRISKNDLKAAKVLYKEGLYAQSIFFFQQSVEKANKSFGLEFGIIKEDDLLQLRHKTPAIYEKYYEKLLLGLEELSSRLKNFLPKNRPKFFDSNNLAESTSELAEHVYDLKYTLSNYKEFANPCESDILDLIENLRRARKDSKRPESVTEHDVEETMSNFKGSLPELAALLGYPPGMDAVSLSDGLSKLNPRVTRILLEFSYATAEHITPAYATFYYLGIISFPHSVMSRYPEFLDLDIKYDLKMPLVKMLPDLIKLQEEATLDFEEYLELKPKPSNSFPAKSIA